MDAGCTDQEAVTIKYDPSGNLLWKAWLKSPVGVAKGVDIGIDSASNSYVLFLLWQKRDSSNQLTDPDVVTAKYNADGVRQWIHYLSSTSAVTRTPVKLSVSPSGDVYVTTVAAGVPANRNQAYSPLNMTPLVKRCGPRWLLQRQTPSVSPSASSRTRRKMSTSW